MIESQYLELKREINDDFLKEVVAFLNTNDGIIYIGIEDDGTVTQLENINKELDKISNMIADNIEPSAIINTYPSIEEIENKKVIKVEIKEGNEKPYFIKNKGFKDGAYLRNGSTSRKMNSESLIHLIKQNDNIPYEDKISKNQKLTFDMINSIFKRNNINFKENNKRTLGLINNENNYTKLGFFLSDQFDVVSKVLVFNSKVEDNLIRRIEFDGSILSQTEAIMNFIKGYNEIKTKFIDDIRLDIPNYPPNAIREAILNAIIHTDYEYSSGVTIKIFEDRLEIISVGGLVKNIKKNEIFNGISILRNKKLADIFFRLGYIERYGTGISKILSSYNKIEMKPKFIIDDNIFKVVLFDQNYYDFLNENSGLKINSSLNQFIDDAINDLEKTRIAYYKNDLCEQNLGKLKNIPIDKIEYINENCTINNDKCTINNNNCTINNDNCTINDEEKIIKLIRNNPNITQQEIANQLNISLRKTKNIFKKLSDENKIVRIGSNKKGMWSLND